MNFNFKPIPRNLRNKRVFLRVDFNVVKNGKVAGDFRIFRTLPTIKKLAKAGSRVIIASHAESGEVRPSLRPLFSFLKKKLKGLLFSPKIAGKAVIKRIELMRPGQVLLLENLRFDPREKQNSPALAKEFSLFCDIYINEAFGASHRRHTSVVAITEYAPSYAGPLMKEEIKKLSQVFKPQRPFLFILGGNKIETKAPVLNKFLAKADKVVIGGAFVAPLLAGRDHKTRQKLVQVKKIAPLYDLVIMRGSKKKTIRMEEIKEKDIIYDLGPKSIEGLMPLIKKSKMILWNGPVGYIEGGFENGTKKIARALTASKAKTIVGGGDTVAYLRKLKLLKKFSFVSTGGGAMLDFLVNETLPGIEALEK